MKMPEIGVRLPVTTAMIFTSTIVIGLVALTRLGLDLMPDIDIPAVSVITGYTGAGPADVETRITEPIEEQVSTVPNLDELTSISIEGLSIVTARFDWSANLSDATNDVRDKVDLAKRLLPDEADTPILFKFDLSNFPIMILGITAEESWPKLDRIVDKQIVDALKRIPGVATATPRGGDTRQINVELDRARLEAFGLSSQKVIDTLRLQNLNNPGGHIRMGYKDYLVRTPEEFAEPRQVGKVVVAQRNGTPVRLDDVARVVDGFMENTQGVLLSGKPGMICLVQKQSGSNTVEVCRRVREELEQIRRDLPPDVKLQLLIDNSDFIRNSVNNLWQSLLYAGFFVFVTILIFLRNVRASIIVTISIPTSLVITFALMYFMGYTLNQVTLSSLAIAIGMVVDNAIVVLDNIHRHRERGQRPIEAALLGANEVGMAVMASTLTSVAIFAPILFVGGLAAILFGALAAVVTMALMASLFVGLMLVPMLCSKFLKVEAEQTNRFFIWSEKAFLALESGYARLLGWAIGHRKSVVVLCLLTLAATFGIVRSIGTEFMPEQDQNQFRCSVELPVGTRFERTGDVCQAVNKIIVDNVPELNVYVARWGVGPTGIGSLLGQREASNVGSVTARLITKSLRKASPRDMINRIRPLAQTIPGCEVRFSAEDPFASILFGGAGKPLAVDLYGYDLDEALQYAADVKTALAEIPGVFEPEASREMERPELQVLVDRDRASSLGINVTDVGKTIETYFSGNTDVKYREAGEEYDIEVRLRPEDRILVEHLRDAFVTSPTGEQIALSSVATIRKGVGPTRIERKGQQRVITVSADISGRDQGGAIAEADERLSRVPPPAGFSYRFSGAEKEKRTAFNLLMMAAGLGLILVYMVMASQFESFRDPFIIFLSIPFGFVGSAWTLFFTGETLSVISFIGLIMLIGVVVNNGIVLISFMGILRKRGMNLRQAVMEGGRSRLRPVLSTTLTTVFGMIPLVVTRGEGSEIWRPLAWTVIGGLSFSTLVTLVLMPTLYAIFEDWGKKEKAVA